MEVFDPMNERYCNADLSNVIFNFKLKNEKIDQIEQVIQIWQHSNFIKDF